MSGKQMGIVFELDLPHEELWVLLSLADNADHDGGKCFPSTERLAWKIGYSKRQVQRILKRLRDKDIIEAVDYYQPNQPSEYQLHLDQAPRKAPFEPKLRRPARRRGVLGDHAESEPGDTLTPAASNNGVLGVAAKLGDRLGGVILSPASDILSPAPITPDSTILVATQASSSISAASSENFSNLACRQPATWPDSELRPNRPLTVLSPTPTPDVVGVGAPPPLPSAEKKPATPRPIDEPVDEPFIAEMVAKYGARLGGATGVRVSISNALNHKAVDKRKSKRLYVDNWLRRDSEDRRQRHGHSPPLMTALTDEERERQADAENEAEFARLGWRTRADS